MQQAVISRPFLHNCQCLAFISSRSIWPFHTFLDKSSAINILLRIPEWKMTSPIQWSAPHTHQRMLRLNARNSQGTAALWLTLCGLSLSTQRCCEPLIIMWHYNWGKYLSLETKSLSSTRPILAFIWIYWIILMDYLEVFSSHYQLAHSVYIAGLSCSVSCHKLLN